MSTATIQESMTQEIHKASVPVTMKAAVLGEFGAPDVLRYEDIATPTSKPGYVLI